MATLGAPVALFLVHAALISVRAGGARDCPSTAQIEESLRTWVPGVVAVPALADAPDVLRLDLTPAPDGGTLLRLRDATGAAVLERGLPAPAPGATRGDCAAVAETIAIIVERYLEQLAVRDAAAPRPVEPARAPPARPRRRFEWWLLAGARAAAPDPWPAPVRFGGAFGPVMRNAALQPYLLTRVGGASSATLPGSELRRVEAAVEPGLGFGEGAASWQLGAAVGVERSTVDRGAPATTWSPWAGPRVAFVWHPAAHVVLRASGGADALIGRLRVQMAGRAMMNEVYAAPTVRLHVGVELGAAFF